MKPMYKVIGAVVIVAIVGGLIYKTKHRSSINRPNQGRSIEELMKSRKEQAEKSLQSPLGQAFTSKDWAKLKSIYQPKTQFVEWGELIRSAYVQNIFQKFTPADLEQITQFTLDTLKAADVQTAPRMSLLSNQFLRLPLPAANSATYQDIEKTALGSNKDPAKEFAAHACLMKILEEDATPSPKVTKLFTEGFAGNTMGLNRAQWIRTIGSIKSPEVKKQMLKALFKEYSHIPTDGQPAALVTLGQFPDENAKEVAKLTMKALKEDNPAMLDAGLRTLFGLIQKKALSSEEKHTISQILNAKPAANLTPFARTKIRELTPLLAH